MPCERCNSEKLAIKQRTGLIEPLLIALTGKRRYRCMDCGLGFRAPDRRRNQRENPAPRETPNSEFTLRREEVRRPQPEQIADQALRIRYWVAGLPPGQEAYIAVVAAENFVRPWKTVRIVNGTIREWQGRYASSEEALSFLQEEIRRERETLTPDPASR